MQPWLFVLLAAVLGYLFGSIPFGLWVTRMYGVDIRTVGSGRTGGTNAWRAAGLKAAIPTILGDALKGAAAVLLVRLLFRWLFPEPDVMGVEEALARQSALHWAAAAAGGLAIVGHNWSIFNNFRGGAGGITAAATAFAISPLVGSVVWIIGAYLIWWTRIASIATLSVGVSALALFLVLASNGDSPWPYVFFGAVALFATTWALRSNREKIKRQEERIITIW